MRKSERNKLRGNARRVSGVRTLEVNPNDLNLMIARVHIYARYCIFSTSHLLCSRLYEWTIFSGLWVKIEGTFTDLKKNLNNHSGMSIRNRVRFINGYFSDRL